MSELCQAPSELRSHTGAEAVARAGQAESYGGDGHVERLVVDAHAVACKQAVLRRDSTPVRQCNTVLLPP